MWCSECSNALFLVHISCMGHEPDRILVEIGSIWPIPTRCSKNNPLSHVQKNVAVWQRLVEKG